MPATIALVDDDRNILTSVSIALQAEGYATRVYSDGETALRALVDNPPDLAVLDVKMPRMDGVELLRRLREKSELPVIFLTSKDEEIDEALGLAMGADDYIAKPFSQRLLIARIRAVLRRAEMRATPPAESPSANDGPQNARAPPPPGDAARTPARRKPFRKRGAADRPWPSRHGSGAAPGDVGRQGCDAYRHRVHDPRSAGAAARRGEVAQSIDGRRLSGRHLCRR